MRTLKYAAGNNWQRVSFRVTGHPEAITTKPIVIPAPRLTLKLGHSANVLLCSWRHEAPSITAIARLRARWA